MEPTRLSPAAASVRPASRKPGPPAFARRIVTFAKQCWRDRLSYLFLAPFLILFSVFIVVPVLMAIFLSMTTFNGIGFPRFVGISHFIAMLTQDFVFMKHTLPNTLKFAVIVGPGGYALAFFFAWLIHQLPRAIRDFFTLALYAPSMAVGVGLSVIWVSTFSGDRVGYLNNILLRFGMIESPVLWLQDPKTLMWVVIIITLWTSMGIGFLAMLGGLQTVNTELYEAGRIDGIKNSLQEVYYITIPSMKPQMLFGAVMSIVNTLKAGEVTTLLTGVVVTPNYAGHLINNHIEDYAFLRYEWGYASALSVLLLLMGYGLMRLSYRLFRTKEDE
ncbi:sugar ABC transporter permease [Paenibacillus antri]|uniref:Sugar ABC transporter permease n=1 Tax=Paenibacillus antri TaxID=2582848 RepID=A0A5R9GFL2_9BACL|nr:sugar ABC transporter permease [Paenibacillus antri]TLS51483.1 sugar ABC transporter permease [Paenibacillus antri]